MRVIFELNHIIHHLPTPAPNYRFAPLGIVLPGTDVGLLPAAVVAVGSAPRFGIVV